ncbi:hypothetical protein M0805_000531 [Coniferiporia weirii]|nr:hypothetical protein M0805_000531 [Coniferiporia weirii]
MSSAAHLSLDSTFGCLYLAVLFSAALWGSGSVQLYVYYRDCVKADRWQLKLYVFLMYTLDSLQQALVLVCVYSYLVKGFNDPESLFRLDRQLVDSVIVSGIVCALAQILFVVRVWHLSNQNRPLTAVLAFLVACQFVTITVYFAKIYNLADLEQFSNVLALECIMNSVVTVTDIAIAAVLAFLLYSLRSGMKQSDSLVRRLIVYTISTGLASSVAGLMALVTALALPNTFIYLIPDIVIAKLYTNSVLALLNSRRGLREDFAGSLEYGIDLESLHTPFTSIDTGIHDLFSTSADRNHQDQPRMGDGP